MSNQQYANHSSCSSNQRAYLNSSATMMTRNRAREQQLDDNRASNSSQYRPLSTPNSTHTTESSPENTENQRQMIRNLVTAAVGAQQAEMLVSLNEQLTQLIKTNIEAGFRRLSLDQNNRAENYMANVNNNHVEYTGNAQNHGVEGQSLDQLLGLPASGNNNNNINNNIETDFHLQPLSLRPDKISQIISNWKLKFSGNSFGLSVDSFIYRIEALTNQTLGGNLDLLCRNASVLFDGKASNWFWRYHKSVREIKWPDLCLSLRRQFKDTRTDMDYRELIRDRKQKIGESFDAFYDSILELVDHLEQPIPELSMIEILRRNLLPEIQHEILNLQIFSVAHLRDIIRKREYFLQDVKKRNFVNRPLAYPKKVSELYEDDNEYHVLDSANENDISELNLICWNCRKQGHRYQDCLSDRNVFCYGCGTANVYRPTCTKCNPQKNFQMSAHPSARRQNQVKKTDSSTSTD
ncbi:hypothetical protein CVS40_12674 [Lucilia cuprina]|nr:hypothetical protein CVS40_12674 [Lucilia cuprina]